MMENVSKCLKHTRTTMDILIIFYFAMARTPTNVAPVSNVLQPSSSKKSRTPGNCGETDSCLASSKKDRYIFFLGPPKKGPIATCCMASQRCMSLVVIPFSIPQPRPWPQPSSVLSRPSLLLLFVESVGGQISFSRCEINPLDSQSTRKHPETCRGLALDTPVSTFVSGSSEGQGIPV